MKPPSPRDVQTDALGPNKHQNASEQTVIIGEGSGGGSFAGAAVTPSPPTPAPAPAQAPAAAPSPAPRRETSQQQTVIMTDSGHTRLLPYPGSSPTTEAKATPVVGWLVVVDGPGKGNFRPVYPGSNTLGRGAGQRIPIDFGDDAISSEKHAFLVYDGRKRQFQLVPNLEKSNLVHLNDQALLVNSEMKPKDRITIGQTTLLFVPLCGEDFDWDAMK